METQKASYEAWYTARHSAHRLAWLYTEGDCLLKCNFPDVKVAYALTVTTLQVS